MNTIDYLSDKGIINLLEEVAVTTKQARNRSRISQIGVYLLHLLSVFTLFLSGKLKMAVNDCFTIGAIVLCTTCFNEEVEGEVLAFDYNTKMLILKCQSKNSEKLNDVYMLNLSFCSNVKVLKECNGNLIEEPQKLNLEQLTLRIRKTLQQRQTYLQSRNADVSPEAQELYRAIAKQFKYNEVSWKGSNIEIFKEVIISPPYSVDDVKSSSNNQTLCNYIKKMIEQFLSARSGSETTTTSTHSSTSSSSMGMGKSVSNATSISPVPAN